MLEEAIPAIWSSMNSWFTPTVLFVLLNLMIGTIAIFSTLGSQKHKDPERTKQQQQQNQYQIYRAPSVLERLKSIDLYRFRSTDLFASVSTPPDPPQTTIPNQESSSSSSSSSPSSSSSSEEEEEEERRGHQEKEEDENVVFYESEINKEHQVVRSKSDSKPASGEMPVKLAKKMKKSASTKSVFDHFRKEEEEERRGHQEKEDDENVVFDESEINKEHQVPRSKSDAKPASGEVPVKLAKKMRKSARTKSVFDHFRKEEEEERRSHQEREEVENVVFDEIEINKEHQVPRSKSDANPASGEVPVKLAKKMKKSASTKSVFNHFRKEDEEKRRPSTVREGKKNASDLMAFGDDEEVDAKADDFINRFKQQLRLQRLDSFLRNKETISRGAASADAK